MLKETRLVAQIMPWRAVAGTELATLRMAEVMRGQGFDSVMFCRTDSKIVAEFFDAHGFDTVMYDGDEFELGLRPFASATRRLADEFKKRDVALVHGADIAAMRPAAAAARLAGKPVISH